MAPGRVAAIGEEPAVRGYALAGVAVLPAADPAAVRAAWRSLTADVAIVLLTPAAARAIGAAGDPHRMVVVLPGEPEP